jgi:sirohydrochlorin ferrochelatase
MRTAALLVCAFLAASPVCAAATAKVGILLLAHGGDEKWNAEVERLRVQVDSSTPTELAFGMADPQTLQAALNRLDRRGVTRIVGVPLFVHSRSEVMDQMRYALGLSPTPSATLQAAEAAMAAMPHAAGPHAHMHMFSLDRATATVPVGLAAALDDDAVVADVLLERAKALSREARSETVVLVAHGPVDDAAVSAWEKSLAGHAASVRSRGGFRGATFAVLRDDAAPGVRAHAVSVLRGLVTAAGRDGGRAIVVPVLIARGGIEDKIPRDLAGLTYAWSGNALLPHAGFDVWVLKRASDLSSAR